MFSWLNYYKARMKTQGNYRWSFDYIEKKRNEFVKSYFLKFENIN